MLEQPLKSGQVELKNRLVMGSMHTGLEEQFFSLSKLARFYEERAKGGTGLIITGGFSPNLRGRLSPFAATFNNVFHAQKHKIVPRAVHKHGGKICLQLLHAGRYAYHPFSLAPSAIKAPINPFTPKAMSERQIKSTIQDYARAAYYAEKAGYDGIEIMASEGYLINEFLAAKTNHRSDNWGGNFTNRTRFAKEIIQAVRSRVSDKFMIIFRLSVYELVEQGSNLEEVAKQAKEFEALGVDIFNTGIGWHEARVPTIASMVPAATFVSATDFLKQQVSCPVIAVNRINTPEIANSILNKGQADLISMARPLLADPEIFNKYAQNKSDDINVCIGCNQGCLDQIFQGKRATCMVNPLACFETEYQLHPASIKKRVLVVGAGPAGLSCAWYLAQRGHSVTVIDKAAQIGGQFKLAMRVPGKEDFRYTLAFFEKQLANYNVDLQLNTEFTSELAGNFDEIVFATGVVPRKVKIKCSEGQSILPYDEVILGKHPIGKKVAILGAGGIGFDMVSFIAEHANKSPEQFKQEWGIMTEACLPEISKQIYLLKRSPGPFGKGLGKTTGWIHRSVAKRHNVKQIAECNYLEYNDKGLVISVKGQQQTLEVDTVIACTGQIENSPEISELKQSIHYIGGVKQAAQIDARRAIFEALQVSMTI